jgi:hypothetical protein
VRVEGEGGRNQALKRAPDPSGLVRRKEAGVAWLDETPRGSAQHAERGEGARSPARALRSSRAISAALLRVPTPREAGRRPPSEGPSMPRGPIRRAGPPPRSAGRSALPPLIGGGCWGGGTEKSGTPSVDSRREPAESRYPRSWSGDQGGHWIGHLGASSDPM